eukprot:TRINITY_DN2990_c0_g1_i2.p1 TRINITY_DN2990_c0_g1~~TRINITY_DN2990_c0_g1_i2.p1  ORF type:complete len:346 (+),score=62.13 TRINITY_DN2990_c0_g1_i2:72-1109(+)
MTQNGSITCLFNGEEIGTELFARVEESGTLVVTSEIDDKVKEYLNTDIRFSNMERHGNNVKISLTSSSSVKGDAIILRSTCEEILNTLSEQLAIFCFQRDFSKKYKFVQTLHRPPKGPSVCVFEKNGVAYVGKVFEKADILKGYNIMSRAMGEIRALQRFSHKNVLTLHEIYSDEKNIVIVTEYMSAGTLYTLISKRITVPEREVALIAKQILDGLVHIHSKGYIHRDIKLENIFIRATKDKEVVPEVIVGDLDLCAEEKQKKWVICGTPGYLPRKPSAKTASLHQKRIFTQQVLSLQCFSLAPHPLVWSQQLQLWKTTNTVVLWYRFSHGSSHFQQLFKKLSLE